MAPPHGWRRMRRRNPNSRAEIEEELHLHLDGRVEEYMAQGMDEGKARELARRQFGDLDRIAAQCGAHGRGRTPGSTGKGTQVMHSIIQDVRYVVRTLLKRPGYAVTVLLTLVLGIGATTAVFSVVSGVLLHPLPHPDPDRLVMVWEVDRRPGFFEDHNLVAAANYADWRSQNSVFESMGALTYYPVTFRGAGDPERVLLGSVTGDFFRTLGTNALIGRTFMAEDTEADAEAVVVLGHSFWQTHFGGDSSIIGKAITIESSNRSVVGVLPPEFDFLDRDFAVWEPRRLNEDALGNRFSHFLRVVARLEPGITLDMAQRDMDRVVSGLRETYPEFLTGWGVNVNALTDEVVGEIRPALLVLLGAVVFVLLIASVNVANLMLIRSASQHRELAIRTALGAGRARLIRHTLTESIVLAFGGGALGVVLAQVATGALLAAAPRDLPRAELVAVDGRVLAFALVVSLATGVLFGLIPALHSSRPDLAGSLKERNRGGTTTRRQQRLRAGFVVSQLAISLVLLISAGLMVRTFAGLTRVDPGFEADGVLTMKLALPGSSYPTIDDQTALYDGILAELEALPGVQDAGLTRLLPLEDGEWTWSAYIQGQPPPQDGEKRDYGYHAVSNGYFRTMGISLKRGRLFDRFDRAGAPPVMIVNEAFVHRFFPQGEDPIGRRMSILGRRDVWMEIVGVVEDVHHYSLDAEPLPAYFGPYAQIPWDWYATEMGLVVRTPGNPAAAVPAIRRIIRAADEGIAISDVRPLRERVAHSVARWRFAMMLLGVFAAVAVTMALIGIYGVVSYAVGDRIREIGVRLALGARPGRIRAQFLARSAKLVAAGVTVGVVVAALFTRFQASLLYGVESVDPLTYTVLSLVLVAVAILATYLPARRASRVDPMVVLREE